MATRPDPRSFLPLPPLDFHLLIGLAEGPRHAYGLATSVEEQPDGVRLELGSLYRIIARLSADGLIEEADAPDGEPRQDARRRYYRLTSLGRQGAGAEAERRATLDRAARQHRLIPARRK
jgi:DNA-binding PadR family transcriptional regulator